MRIAEVLSLARPRAIVSNKLQSEDGIQLRRQLRRITLTIQDNIRHDEIRDKI